VAAAGVAAEELQMKTSIVMRRSWTQTSPSTPMNPNTTVAAPRPRAIVAACALAALLASPLAWAQKAFPSADAAANVFVDAVATHDTDALRGILGADYRRFVPEADQDDITAFLYASSKGRRIVNDSADQAHLSVGTGNWTLPIPIVKSADGWRFDVKAGAQEMRYRRIGRNELAAMQALLAYFDAQKEYAAADRDGDGINSYAQRFVSTRGKHDGLIWLDDVAGSPLGPLYGNETRDGVYHGYRFRILKAQGPSARGGARDYVSSGRMTRGFAAIAWPAKHGETGVMSFLISHEGVVYQKNLGANTDGIARAVTRFDPDASWQAVPMTALVAK